MHDVTGENTGHCYRWSLSFNLLPSSALLSRDTFPLLLVPVHHAATSSLVPLVTRRAPNASPGFRSLSFTNSSASLNLEWTKYSHENVGIAEKALGDLWRWSVSQVAVPDFAPVELWHRPGHLRCEAMGWSAAAAQSVRTCPPGHPCAVSTDTVHSPAEDGVVWSFFAGPHSKCHKSLQQMLF